MKTITVVAKFAFCCWLLAALSGTVFAQAVLRDLGTNLDGSVRTPTPGPLDITNITSNLSFPIIAFPAELNYYDNNVPPPGQTFYVPRPMALTSVALQLGGDHGPWPSLGPTPFWLRIFSIEGASATLVATYESQTNATLMPNHWMQWTNIACPLISASGNFAYTFACDPSDATGWMELWAVSGNTYPGGQICLIDNAGGANAVHYGSSGLYDANFCVGLAELDCPVLSPISVFPTNTIFLGTTVTLRVMAGGQPPPSYWWQTDGGGGGALTNIPGANTNFYTYTPPAAGIYHFATVGFNTCGSGTSTVFAVTVLPASPPLLTTDMDIYNTNVYAFYGGSVGFHAEFNLGTLPITNQWLVKLDSGGDYTPVAGATGWYWTLTNVQSTSAGFYELAATNAAGRSNSTPAHLTALARPAAPSVIWGTNIVGTTTNVYDTSYAHYVLTNKPWAYWRFDETTNSFTNSMQAYDYSGNNFNATYASGTHDAGGVYVANSGAKDGGECRANGQYGPQPADGYAGFEGTPALGTNLCAGFVYNVANNWLTVPPLNINTNTVTFTMWIYTSGDVVAANTGLLMWHNGMDVAGVGFGTGIDMGSGRSMAELGYVWNTNSVSTLNYHSKLYLKSQTWSFAAWVISPASTTIYLYSIDNGSGKTNLLKAVSATPNTPESFMGGTTCLGTDNFNPVRTFPGYIDEVAVFTNALSEATLQSMFLRSAGMTSGIPPLISVPPQPPTVFQGQPLRISVVAGGIPAPTYQWQGGTNCTSGTLCFNGKALAGNIPGATNATLILTNTTFNYLRVIAGNAYGKATSSWAKVTFIPIPGSTNAQWTMNFNVASSQNGGPNAAYNGRGVLGKGTNWNALRGFPLQNSSYLLDDGSTGPAIQFGATNGIGTWYHGGGGVTGLALLDQYADIGTNGTAFIFTNVPSGKYNLALYGIDGVYADRATAFTVLGVTQIVTNEQDVNFAPDNTVIYTNVVVMNGTLEVAMTPVTGRIIPLDGFLPEPPVGAFNGAQLQLVTNWPAFTGFTNSGSTCTMSWMAGQLLETTNVSGPWITNPAVSPFTFTPTGAMKFYQIYNPDF